MKLIVLLSLLIGSQHIFAASCDIEKGYYLISKPARLKVKVDSCDPTPGWGQGRKHFATFDKVDLTRAKRELLAEHRPLICLLYTSPSPRDQRGSRMPSSA